MGDARSQITTGMDKCWTELLTTAVVLGPIALMMGKSALLQSMMTTLLQAPAMWAATLPVVAGLASTFLGGMFEGLYQTLHLNLMGVPAPAPAVEEVVAEAPVQQNAENNDENVAAPDLREVAPEPILHQRRHRRHAPRQDVEPQAAHRRNRRSARAQ